MENLAPLPFCPPQIPHYLTWTRTRAVSVGSQRLTAWAMARPLEFSIIIIIIIIIGGAVLSP
jgi:hypothetical protein